MQLVDANVNQVPSKPGVKYLKVVEVVRELMHAITLDAEYNHLNDCSRSVRRCQLDQSEALRAQ
jgi:hypothetical protein